jgi:hypothetical protein
MLSRGKQLNGTEDVGTTMARGMIVWHGWIQNGTEDIYLTKRSHGQQPRGRFGAVGIDVWIGWMIGWYCKYHRYCNRLLNALKLV